MTAPLSPRARYERDLRRPGFSRDPAQAAAVAALQSLHEELIARRPRRRLRGLEWPAVRGLYLWGGVGRGKTYLMDAFYESLPFTRKRRTHFHRFMQEVHERRKQYAQERDPLALLGAQIARELRVLCFDEFFVADIADAMILGRLLETLFAQGVTLVATSNVPPDGLYKDGLQRQNFLPAIESLKTHCRVLQVDGGTDYRLRTLTRAEIYHVPSDASAERNLLEWFEELASEPGQEDVTLEITGRSLRARRAADGVVWFDFAEICETARSAADYVEIARTHHSVLISRIHRLTWEHEDAAQRFINLVDEFYDRGVKLIIAAEVPATDLYAGNRLRFEFQRTVSRLLEMQSREFLARPHRP